jgi:hypothetical protein
MNNALIDYRYAWRWLLPDTPGGTLRLKGFSGEEEKFWREVALPSLGLGMDESGAKLLVVDGANCSEEALPSQSELVDVRTIGIVLNRASARQWRPLLQKAFPMVREYALLPSGNPRVVVPLSSAHHAVIALGLHRPGRLLARLALSLARILVRVGNFALIRGRVLLIATREDNFIPREAVQSGLSMHGDIKNMDYALYLGTPDDNRKTVVLPLGAATPGGILKVAQTPKARASLRNEAEALQVMSGFGLAACVPRLIDLVPSAESLSLYQEYRPRRRVSRQRLEAGVVQFLGEISFLERQFMPLSAVLANLSVADMDLSEPVAHACSALRMHLQALGEQGVDVVLHRVHGDFAPWNCTWTQQGFFVFDWEESRGQGLALSDAFYYTIAPVMLVRPDSSAMATLDAALNFAEKIIASSGVNWNSQIYLALWLLGRVQQSGLYGELVILLAKGWK